MFYFTLHDNTNLLYLFYSLYKKYLYLSEYTLFTAMKKYIVLLGLFCLFSCGGEDNDICCMNITDTFTVILKNKQGEDLLNPSHVDCIVPDSIKLFYVVNNVEYEIYNPQRDSPRNFFVYQNTMDGLYRIQFYANHSPEEPYPITYIQWTSHDRDTVKCLFDVGQNHINLNKLWYNNSLRIDMAQDGNMEFEVIK